jgi:hypothetical protein
MIITTTGIATRTIYATHWFGDFATYRNAGGLILAHIPSGMSCYFQPGDDANGFENEADALLDTLTDDDEHIWNAFCDQYIDVMIEPAQAGGAPSSDGGFYAFN